MELRLVPGKISFTRLGLALLGKTGVQSTTVLPFCFCSGLTEFHLAFCCYLQQQFFNWAAVPADVINSGTAAVRADRSRNISTSPGSDVTCHFRQTLL